MSELARLAPQRYLSLATFRRNGSEVRTPVWFAETGDKLYVFTAGESGKVKRLRHSPAARIAPCDARGRVLGGWLDATARLIDAASEVERAHRILRTKYGWQMWLADALARVTGRYQRRAWIEIEPRSSP